jgi:type IV pilus assembly protein PilO
MKLSDLNNLSFDNIGTWPVPIKIAFAALVFAAILVAGWFVTIKDQREALRQAQGKEQTLKTEFENKQKQAANLNALKQQLADIEETFGDLLKRLPSKTEVAELLVDISQQGLASGLEFELFKPGNEQQADFYVELPIQITVLGTYHEFGNFISGVSDLPRIVTNHDIKIKPAPDGRLSMQTTAKTYRYMDEEEEAAVAAKEAAAKKRKGAAKK